VAAAPLSLSKSQRKRDAHAFQALGGRLVALSAAPLARLELPEALHEAVVAAQRMCSHGAGTYQMQSIGTLMGQLDRSVLIRVRAVLASGRAGTPRPEPSIRQAPHQRACKHALGSATPGAAADEWIVPETQPRRGHVASSASQRNRELPHGQT
jgi:hypothetical protein